MIRCLNCKAEFDQSSAYCEDWQKPTKKLGCPDCHTFHLKVDEKFDLVIILEAIIFMISCFGFINAFINSDVKTGIYFGIIFVANGILILKNTCSRFDKVKLVDS